MNITFHTILAMFGVPSGGEILLVLLVVLLLFGSKNLPHMARTLGRMLEEFRRASREVTDEIMQAGDDSAKPQKPLPGSVPKEDDGEETSATKAAPPKEDGQP